MWLKPGLDNRGSYAPFYEEHNEIKKRCAGGGDGGASLSTFMKET